MKSRKLTGIIAMTMTAGMLFTACGSTESVSESAASETSVSSTATSESEVDTASDAESVVKASSEAEAVVEATSEPESAVETASASTETASEDDSTGTVTVTDIYGETEVPVNPEVVVSLDNRTFETLSDWGIALAAAPKDVMPADSPYVTDENVVNIGNHREPDLEALAAVDPDLVIVGQRFASYYEDIKELVPNAVVIDFSFDVDEAENTGENLVNGLKDSTTALGQIFEKETEAQALCDDLDAAIAGVQDAYNGTDTILSVVVSGGEIGYSAPVNGRVWGPLYQVFDWISPIEVENTTSDHQGDDISIEAIADANPDWIMVLDRDAAVSSEEGAQSAADVIENAPALANVTAITEGQIVYAPNDTYTNESIQTYLELLADMQEAFAHAAQ